MTTYRFGKPSDFKRTLQDNLPRLHGLAPEVRVNPRNDDERSCAAWAADHYEVQAYYTTTVPGSLDLLEDALSKVPGVYLTTRLHSAERGQVSNPDWPAILGAKRRGFADLRPQVLALVRDPAPR